MIKELVLGEDASIKTLKFGTRAKSCDTGQLASGDTATASEDEEYYRILEKIKSLNVAENNLIYTLMSAASLRSRSPLFGKDRTKSDSSKIVTLHNQAASLVRQNAAIQNLVQQALYFFEERLALESEEQSQWKPKSFEKLGDRFALLESSFQEIYHDQLEDTQKVKGALENPRWEFRTINGIAKETQLPEKRVAEILECYPSWFRKSVAKDNAGNDLYTLTARPVGLRERLAAFQSVLKDS